MQGVSPATAAAAGEQGTSRPAGPAVAADAMYLQLHPVPPPAAIPAIQPHTSSHDSAGTGHTFAKGTADPKQQQQQQATGYGSGHFVPRKDSNDNIPCFVQTSALFTNVRARDQQQPPAAQCTVNMTASEACVTHVASLESRCTAATACALQMCGYCGTRSTSGCWRRGWEIGPNRFINLCNKWVHRWQHSVCPLYCASSQVGACSGTPS